jgi:hypothetical protein
MVRFSLLEEISGAELRRLRPNHVWRDAGWWHGHDPGGFYAP